IGTEELPPSVQRPAASELAHRIVALFSGHELAVSDPEVFWSPRRLAVRVADVPDEKSAQEVELQGPPKKAAFDSGGKPTRTLLGFCAAHGKTPADVYLKPTARGEYVCLRKILPAVPTATILLENLGPLIASLPFPRTMRWQDNGTRFPRPVRWLLCLLGNEAVPFEFGALVAGNTTLGHRNFTTKPAVVANPAAYEEVLLQHKVIPSPDARRAAIESGLAALATDVKGVLVPDPDLLDETVNITEYPEPILCSFNPDYLSLPRPLLITALRKHQRCFSISLQDLSLLPYFVAVANTPGCDQTQVRTWYEKAAESRLKDARFFFDADLKLGLEPLVDEEKRVVWIEGMGTLHDKTGRLRRLCRHLVSAVRLSEHDARALDRAALLCKADLLTQVVREKEFTSLQGIMGGIYAKLAGELEPVCSAIAEHYLPAFVGDRLPGTSLACLLSLADKTDNIAAAFASGAIPTGSEDPLALRRQATGILTIILELKLSIDVQELTRSAARLFPSAESELPTRLDDFFRERMAALLTEKGVRYDIAAAVLATAWHTPVEALARTRALAEFRSRPEFEKLIIGQKRVANILKGTTVEGLPEPELLGEKTERELWQQSREAEPELDEAIARADHVRALELLLGLRPTIDKFFNDVLVMAEDLKLRDNRLRLLSYVRSLFRKVADLSLIVLEGEPGT
ncbi:MAG: glycine--tRNA ligase subunit beta, partial [candidate division WOR-3 bacterium]